jgi:hypothetical protein
MFQEPVNSQFLRFGQIGISIILHKGRWVRRDFPFSTRHGFLPGMRLIIIFVLVILGLFEGWRHKMKNSKETEMENGNTALTLSLLFSLCGWLWRSWFPRAWVSWSLTPDTWSWTCLPLHVRIYYFFFLRKVIRACHEALANGSTIRLQPEARAEIEKCEILFISSLFSWCNFWFCTHIVHVNVKSRA